MVSTTIVMASPVDAACDPATQKCCGGVETSLIVCEERGVCDNGVSPFEGANPNPDNNPTKNDAAIKQYNSRYNHEYGKCDLAGTLPRDDVQGTGIWGILELALNILTAGIGIAAVGGVVYGAILYTSAGGNTEQVKKAYGIFANVAIGIIAYALMYAGLNFLIPGGLFG